MIDSWCEECDVIADLISWLYFAKRSDLQGAPVLIWTNKIIIEDRFWSEL